MDDRLEKDDEDEANDETECEGEPGIGAWWNAL